MSSPTKTHAYISGVVAVAVGVVASAFVVWRASNSAFSATTSNPTNNWTAGQLALVDDDSNTALFTVTGMKPGDTGSKCIVVTSNSNIASTVKMYGTAFAQTKTVADNMTLKVEQGDSTSTGGNCTGFTQDVGASNISTTSLTAFSTARTNYGNGFGTWGPAAGSNVKKTYRITWTFNNAANQTLTDAMQGGTAQIGFTWEAQAGT